MSADPTEVDPCPMERLAYEFASVCSQLAEAWKDPESRKLLTSDRERILNAFDEVWDIDSELFESSVRSAAE